MTSPDSAWRKHCSSGPHKTVVKQAAGSSPSSGANPSAGNVFVISRCATITPALYHSSLNTTPNEYRSPGK